ncbi:MAG TPA: glycosyltransferase [Roseomonas sp.]|nr:glycosyltransferase [Roseomonas sp.]
MKLVVFGLTISSSWGNGHATLWRALCKALVRRGHRIVFFEKDVPWYAESRDLTELPGVELILYPDWQAVRPLAERHLADAEVGMVTSYCPDGIAASELVARSPAEARVFYDLDTPVTLARLAAGEPVGYLPPQGLGSFDLVLSYTGGAALTRLRTLLGARRVAPLYGSVDPEAHQPTAPAAAYQADLSYLGTYAADRQASLEALLVRPARQMPERRFVIGGAQYPADFPWSDNIFFVRHLPPAEHPAFFSSARLTLNITRQAMAEMGYCPSGRLFEAAACGALVLSDGWEGLDGFYAPGSEILVANTTEEAMAALAFGEGEIRRMAARARQRTLEEHTADHRARDLEAALALVSAPEPDALAEEA